MDTAISAADANRAFSRLLREVREEGRSFVVTAHGKPVARLVPCDAADAARGAARAGLLARLSSQPVVDVGRWSRDELYER
jgi:prevent-host-death family protein